ncbi:MAG: CTP synthase [Candidatus Caldarchaeum sp.]|nr:CTP synthase [Candidatus Caldarchaeum sp.]MCX8200516.1 CTP synthase [Candidatus Caldarchaeum sp.]MDW8435562.1 CTP synthase [Candidatus Caldarchaeum sp.]
MPKYVFVTGGVVSSVGKGTVAAAIGKILSVRGIRVGFVKIDPYVNVDAGTLNPFSHGEVFVTDDGGETDLDLGWYERFLDIKTSRLNNITTGQIYAEVIARERRGDYLGQCVQIVPHVTDEIKRRIRLASKDVEVLIVEVGGTVGDIEGQPFLEAIRQMRLEEGVENTLFAHVALVLTLKATGEFKTKSLQHSVNALRGLGIQPDVIVARSDQPIDAEARRKIALFGTITDKAVFCSYDVECVYKVPVILEEQGMGDFIVDRLKLNPSPPDWSSWHKVVSMYENARFPVKIAVCGKYTKLADSYVSIKEALYHAGVNVGARVDIEWISTEDFEQKVRDVDELRKFDGVLVPGGFGKRGTEGMVECIRFSRENDIPFLGICFGLQLSVVEFARNVCGLHGANSTELNPSTPHPVIDLMPEQRHLKELGGTMRLGAQTVKVVENTLAHSLYGTSEIRQRHRHRYEVNPEYWGILQKNGLVFSGFSPEGDRVEIIEYPKNRFFLATQFHPEYLSRPNRPEPAYLGFVKAAAERRKTVKTAEAVV